MLYQLVDGESVQEVKATLEHTDEMIMLEDFEKWAREYVCQQEPDLIGVEQPPIYSWLQLAYLPNVRIVPTLQRLRNEIIRGRKYFGSFVCWLCENKGFKSVNVVTINARSEWALVSAEQEPARKQVGTIAHHVPGKDSIASALSTLQVEEVE